MSQWLGSKKTTNVNITHNFQTLTIQVLLIIISESAHTICFVVVVSMNVLELQIISLVSTFNSCCDLRPAIQIREPLPSERNICNIMDPGISGIRGYRAQKTHISNQICQCLAFTGPYLSAIKLCLGLSQEFTYLEQGVIKINSDSVNKVRVCHK